MYRPNYHRATRQAYRTLLAAKIDRLPVDVVEICARCHDTTLVSFRAARDIMGWEFDPFFDGPSRYAITIRRWRDGRAYHTIIWNDEEMSHNSGQFRFAIAHELAHVILRHPGGLHPASELEANVYAQHLLCPRPVLEVIQPRNHLEISYMCGVSRDASRLVYDLLQQENRYVDRDMWNGIFAAFDLEQNRNTADFLSEFNQRRLARAHGL